VGMERKENPYALVVASIRCQMRDYLKTVLSRLIWKVTSGGRESFK
jgi:hypothetical protein